MEKSIGVLKMAYLCTKQLSVECMSAQKCFHTEKYAKLRRCLPFEHSERSKIECGTLHTLNKRHIGEVVQFCIVC